MKDQWMNTAITKIAMAVYVAPGTGKNVHTDRPYHGFVLNDENGIKNYHFSDGQVLHTRENEVFYLPKGSSYTVRSVRLGGCYAINFDADISDEPFSLRLRDHESLRRYFKTAAADWKAQSPLRDISAMRAVYETIYLAQKELQKEYSPKEQASKIAPAIEKLSSDFTDNSLTVSYLSELCGMSEVYFRRIFINRFGVSPKEYMIRKRIEYAKQLLSSGQFSIKEVAELCGYSEPCHFSREFSKRVGVSPTDYR
ncbi:MAG: helix-turn-helix transcriptional regulator [Clostridia bacterium]|nr:helix-turn-helix transcriptional regulator [Clostridia bacterium]